MEFTVTIEWIGIALLVGAVGLLVATLLTYKPPVVEPEKAKSSGSEGPVFLFDGETMADCNASARAILARSAARGSDWRKLITFLSPYFPEIEDRLTQLQKLGALAETGSVGNGKVMLLQAEHSAGLTKISLLDPDIAEGPGLALAMSHRALETEVEDLRRAISAAPILMWRESAQGAVVWANSAYVVLAASTLPRGRDLHWPLPRLFERNAVVQSSDRQRQSLTIAANRVAWFDLVTEAEAAGDGLMCFALPVDAAVAAETSLREFMQTLAKTFAQLPIGLAIFDKDRKLQMFNPALMELTTLAADFLSKRPSMLAVLDAMRDRNLLPEPKDYHSWRRQITEMERAAATGLFQENWALPDGQTFRVTGRPHPNGGLALMIEDISTEMQRSRRYRADLEVSQSVIDQLDDAIAVFSQAGHLMWCNTAYIQLWGHDPAANLGEMTIRTIADHWKTRAAPTALWGEIDEYIHTVGQRAPWQKDLRLQDGRLFTCAVAPVAAGSTMIAFKTVLPSRAPRKTDLAPARTKPSGRATAAK